MPSKSDTQYFKTKFSFLDKFANLLFYNRKTTELKLSNEITAIEIKKFQITEKGITLNFKEKGITQQLLDAKELSQDDWKEYINSIE